MKSLHFVSIPDMPMPPPREYADMHTRCLPSPAGNQYDSYGWINRPSKKDFESMVVREKDWKDKLLEFQNSTTTVADTSSISGTVRNAAFVGEDVLSIKI